MERYIGNVAKVSTAKDGMTLVLADNMAYKPFGPLAAMTLGAGRGISTEFDLNYRHLSRTVPGILERSLSYDPAGRIISIADQLDSTRNQNFGYDKAGRLTSATGPYGTLGFTYDRTGNRLTRTLDDAALTYTYTQGTNRLAQISGTGSQTDLVYDGAGKPLSKGDMNFAYTQAGRLATVSGSGNEIAAYLYNSLGQRTRKTVDGKTTLFHYDLFGNLIGESSPDGTFSMTYVYTDSTRLAALAMESTTQPDVAYYINDHLGTPIKMIDNDGRVVWDGASLPFGRVNESLGEVQSHFRFPGQYYDQETGLHYNHNRFYDPMTGSYISADPIGLAGGINPFTYAKNNPPSFIDPFGLFVLGINTGGSGFYWGGVGKSSALLFESDGKTNKFGLVTTSDKGIGKGYGLFNHIVYSDQGTIKGYANTSFSNSGSYGYGSYSWSFGQDDAIYYEGGISPIPGASGNLTSTQGKVIFSFEYSFGAADHFWGDLLYDLLHPEKSNECD
ncbi:MAG: RHS repeat-associated core domain-containing protein [Desulfobacter sp.]